MSQAAHQQDRTEHPSSVPPFVLAGVAWRCWVVDGGQRYEWRADGRPLAVTRSGRVWRASVAGKWLPREHARLVDAMTWAIIHAEGTP